MQRDGPCGTRVLKKVRVNVSLSRLFLFHVSSLKGVKRFDARQLVVDALIEKKLFRGKKSHAMTLPICR